MIPLHPAMIDQKSDANKFLHRLNPAQWFRYNAGSIPVSEWTTSLHEPIELTTCG